jgi:capsular exopolysaccharide synthesis family protein
VQTVSSVETPLRSPERGGSDTSARRLIGALLRREHLIVTTFALTALAALLVFSLLPARYTTAATLLVDPGVERVLQDDQALAQTSPSEARVDNEVEILKSPTLHARVVARLDLASNPIWNPKLRPGNFLGGAVDWARGLFQRTDTPQDVDPAVLRHFSDSVSVRRRGVTSVVDIRVTARDAREAARIANVLVDEYFALRSEQRLDTAQRASTWLSGRLEELRADVIAKEAAAQSYRSRSGLLTAAGVSLKEQQVSDVQRAMLQARAQLAESEARYRQVQRLNASGGSADTLGFALSSEVVRDLRQREVDLRRRQAEFESTLGPLHPRVQSGRAEINGVRQQIAAEISRIEASFANEMQVARTSLAMLERNLAQLQGGLNEDNVALVRLNELERDSEASRAVYESFLRRYHEVANQGQLETSSVQLISLARVPDRRSSPRLLLSLLIALALATAAGIGLALLAELFDDTIRNADQVEQQVGARVLTTVPALPGSAVEGLAASERHPAGYVLNYPMSGAAEAFRVLLTHLSSWRTPENLRFVVAMSSALPGEGKTTSTLALGRVAALAGYSVLVVDCDLRRRSLTTMLDAKPEHGLLDVLSGKAQWNQVVALDEKSGAKIIALPETAAAVHAGIDAVAMKTFLAEVRAHHQLVLLDCPPVLAVAEARVVAALADCVVVIARANKTPKPVLQSALDQLDLGGANIAGVVVNAVDVNVPGLTSFRDGVYYRYMRDYYTEGRWAGGEPKFSFKRPVSTGYAATARFFGRLRGRLAGRPSPVEGPSDQRFNV